MSSEALQVQINDKLINISELKVTELKAELKKRSISSTGNKLELFEKLKNVNFK